MWRFFAFYKANWNEQPMLHLANKRLQTIPENMFTITAFSNLNEMELYVNGRTVGKTRPDADKICKWPHVKLLKGRNEIQARGMRGGQAFTDQYTLMVE